MKKKPPPSVDELQSFFDAHEELKLLVKELREDIREVREELEKIRGEELGYIDELKKEGFIAFDGKTALTSLYEIAGHLIKKIELDSVTPQLLITSFVQKNGKKYSLRTAQDAIQRSKTQ
jgi:hypothetical protein